MPRTSERCLADRCCDFSFGLSFVLQVLIDAVGIDEGEQKCMLGWCDQFSNAGKSVIVPQEEASH